MTPMRLNSTTIMSTEVPTSPHSAATEKETTLNTTITMSTETTSYSPTTMSKEKEATPNATTTMSTEKETMLDSITTMSTKTETEIETKTIPDPITTMSTKTTPDPITTISTKTETEIETETTPDPITTMSTKTETEIGTETTPDSTTTMSTTVQTSPNPITTKEETETLSTRIELTTDNKSQLLKAIQHTQSLIRNCSSNADCQTNQICNRTLNQCFCDFGFAFDSKGQCLENNECDCLKGSYSDNSTCSKEQTLDFLFVVKDIVAKRVEQSEDNKHPQTYVAVENDCVNKTAYYVKKSSTSYGKSEILKISYNGDEVVSFIEEYGYIEGISIDWTLRNIYWINSNEIKVINLQQDEVEPTTLIKNNIINPRDIVVHPGKGKIFWSNWYPENNTAQLMWANINGSNISVFYESDKVRYPNALAINWVNNQLCWSDKITKEINCVGIGNTTNLQTIATGVFEPYDLEITADNYYWTNLEKKEILEFDGNDKKQQVIMSLPDDADSILYGFVGVPSKCPELQ
ncbi:nidogen-like [Aphidius gifuensis]|uniref:nidogen-like n=1 Tax=Aphidius gifuensis TaxID=684658 RepID=UPI001CDBFD05|nr:nidogen-like [Aphidius gifuensis]